MSQTSSESQAPTSTDSLTLTVALQVLQGLITFICLLGITGNGVVAWLLGTCVSRAPFCVYVLHLSLADLLFLLCMLLAVLLDKTSVAYAVVKRVKLVADTASLSLLTVISLQRCLSVLFPLWYKCSRPQHLSATVSGFLWALAILAGVLLAFLCNQHQNVPEPLPGEKCFFLDFIFRLLTLSLVTPLMTFSSLILFLQVQRTSRRWLQRGRRRRPTRLYWVILMSVLAFLVCTLPLGIFWVLIYLLQLPPEVNNVFRHLGRLLSAISCSVHPVIYFLVDWCRGRSWRQSVRQPLGSVLQRVLQEEPEPGPMDPPSNSTGSMEGP